MMRTAESVAIGHPDKVCDQIADAILDAHLRRDPCSRVAVEVLGGHGNVYIVGEITSKEPLSKVDIQEVALRVLKDTGTVKDENIGITVNVVTQSPQIAQGVDTGGAGDQGIMVGYACDETPEFLPKEVAIARRLVRLMGDRDGKAQVTIKDGRVDTIITSVCGLTEELEHELKAAIDEYGPVNWLLNPAGEWTIGGFAADTGLTGRKLAVDAYGPRIPLGGGAFSGKDATKVDRSAAYMARKIAVDYLKNRNAHEVFVHLAYAIGVAEPVMAVVTIDGAEEAVEGYDLTPNGIIEFLKLREPQFEATARYGHFGNGFTWDV